jgi:polygalacturonase
MVKEANAQEPYINAWEDHILIQPGENCDRYYTLTRMVVINGCNVDVNDHLCLELMYY